MKGWNTVPYSRCVCWNHNWTANKLVRDKVSSSIAIEFQFPGDVRSQIHSPITVQSIFQTAKCNNKLHNYVSQCRRMSTFFQRRTLKTNSTLLFPLKSENMWLPPLHTPCSTYRKSQRTKIKYFSVVKVVSKYAHTLGSLHDSQTILIARDFMSHI